MGAQLSLIRRRRGWRLGWALIRGWPLLTFSAFRMGAYSRWALIRGWAFIRINTVLDLNKLLEQDAKFTGRVISVKPKRSPLIQGGLEIPMVVST